MLSTYIKSNNFKEKDLLIIERKSYLRVCHPYPKVTSQNKAPAEPHAT